MKFPPCSTLGLVMRGVGQGGERSSTWCRCSVVSKMQYLKAPPGPTLFIVVVLVMMILWPHAASYLPLPSGDPLRPHSA